MKERRRSERFQLALPLILICRSQGAVNEICATRNLSSRGLYFVGAVRIEPGSLLEFIVTLPEEVSPTGTVRLLCRGKVKRVEQWEESLVGIAATIERYQFLRDGLNGPCDEIFTPDRDSPTVSSEIHTGKGREEA